jgi:TonB dependent receptor/Carboxypeptidase regulatory-like domain/TonB-dependent Receptor Plug Domain
MRRTLLLSVLVLFFGSALLATVFGTVRGIVHDPQHRPVSDAKIVLQARNSAYNQTAQTDAEGQFHFDAVPLGAYTVTVSQDGFQTGEQNVTVLSGTAPILHFELRLETQNQSVTVTSDSAPAQTESVTPTTLIDREQISATPGASRANSVAMITDYTPGAYVTHDQLHIRGGHQISWLIDGVAIPNTNIASNLGPQIDPKDIDVLEMQRGSYSADYGDRTYGVFNVAPRTGFERNNEGELVLSAGNFYQTDDQLNFGGHTNRLAYYTSVSGNRTNLGLETPTSVVNHDAANGIGGFGSLIYNLDSQNQLRFVAQARRDFYQVPFDANDPNIDPGSSFHDVNRESDAFVTFSWAHTFNPGLLLTVSPFYHFNRADFESDPNDFPSATTDNRASKYEGGQATVAYVKGRNNARAGIYGFAQQDDEKFGVLFNDLSNPNLQANVGSNGSLLALYAEDQFRVTSWLNVSAGVRQTHFSGGVVENATSPRFGASVRVPKLNWVFRGFYGHFYQAPPLLTASGPLIDFVTSQNLGFVPLHGERDEESQFGVTIPCQSWTVDADTFRTRARNFFDHSSVGNSDIFFPLTIDGALIRGWELTVRSPRIRSRGQLYITYSNQVATGSGAINGGLTDFAPPDEGSFLLDHDQRNTLHVGGTLALPWRSNASADVYYGSGFALDDGPPFHLPGHTTFDLALSKEFGERFTVAVDALNVANRRFLLDNSVTFGGTHFVNPREIVMQLRWRFHY